MIVLKERGIDAMGEYLRNINWKHVLIMCIGNVFAGMGIGIFKLAGLGTDPFSGMNMAVADMLCAWLILLRFFIIFFMELWDWSLWRCR